MGRTSFSKKEIASRVGSDAWSAVAGYANNARASPKITDVVKLRCGDAAMLSILLKQIEDWQRFSSSAGIGHSARIASLGGISINFPNQSARCMHLQGKA